MNAIHAGLVKGFYLGDDAVLLILNIGGTTTFLASLTEAARQGSAQLDLGDTAYQFVIEAGAAHVEFGARTVVWRLTRPRPLKLSKCSLRRCSPPMSRDTITWTSRRPRTCWCSPITSMDPNA
jgi:hypothetical protein